MATQVLLIVSGLTSVLTIGVEVFGIGAVTRYLDGLDYDIELLNAYDRVSLMSTVVSSMALVATGVLWLIWQYRAAKQVQGRTRRSPGWHVGSWLIPVVSFWFPYQNISDLWRATGRSRPAWQILWWLLWISSGTLIQVSSIIYNNAEVLEQFRDSMWASIAGEVLRVAAVPLAWMVVRGITRGLSRGTALPAPARWNADPGLPLGR
ncbi:hypothetical protein ASD93_08505 [Microbacterium sp. Root180]|nr:hypothetical protein ASD93_08505 [Microbacterium sp. Root180]